VFGDIASSLKSKDIFCYITYNDNDTTTWTTVADENKDFTVTNISGIRFGSEKKDTWTYGLLANGTYKCTSDLLGYSPGTLGPQVCQIGEVYPLPVFNQPLADPGKDFELLEADAVYSVYHGSFIVQMASTGSITCDPTYFGLKGYAPATCGLVEALPIQFNNPVAEWFQAETCSGTSSCTYTLSEGVTSTTTDTTTTNWAASLSGTTSLGMTYKGFSVDGKLTPTISTQLTLMQQQAYTMTVTQNCAASCATHANETVVMWQWVMTTNELNFDPKLLPRIANPFQTLVCSYLCLEQGLLPACPPGYCSDETCQTCSQPLFV
jgi:hypothetical protein